MCSLMHVVSRKYASRSSAEANSSAIVPDAFGDAGQPRDERGVESVLQQDGAIEALGAEARGERPPGAGVWNDPVDGSLAGVEIGHPGARGDGDVGVDRKSVV